MGMLSPRPSLPQSVHTVLLTIRSLPPARLLPLLLTVLITLYLLLSSALPSPRTTRRTLVDRTDPSAAAPKLAHPDTLVPNSLTIGVTSHVCSTSAVRRLAALLLSLRAIYPTTRILIANTGQLSLSRHAFLSRDLHTDEVRLDPSVQLPAARRELVRRTSTPFLLLLREHHLVDLDTDLASLVKAAESNPAWDVVSIRVRNLPGVRELELLNVIIPHHVANVSSLQDSSLRLCRWDENTGASMQGLKHALPIDIGHDAFMIRTKTTSALDWKNHHHFNERLAFYLEAKQAKLRVGYFPSIFVHRRPDLDEPCFGGAAPKTRPEDAELGRNESVAFDAGCERYFSDYAAEFVLAGDQATRFK